MCYIYFLLIVAYMYSYMPTVVTASVQSLHFQANMAARAAPAATYDSNVYLVVLRSTKFS